LDALSLQPARRRNGGDIAARKLALERIAVAERNRIAVGKSGPKAVAKLCIFRSATASPGVRP